MEWLGQYHPFIAHFTIGLLPAGVLIFIIYFWSKHEWFLYTAATLFTLSTLASIISWYTGDIAHELVERIPGVREAIHNHEYWANIVMRSNIVLSALTLVYIKFKDKEILRYNQDAAHWLVATVGIWCVIAVILTGKNGGNLVFDYMVAGGARGNTAESINRQANAYYYNQLDYLKSTNEYSKMISVYREIETNFPENVDFKIMYAEFLFQQLNQGQEAITKLNEAMSLIKDPTSRVYERALIVKHRAYTSLNDKAGQDAVLADLTKNFPNSNYLKNIK